MKNGVTENLSLDDEPVQAALIRDALITERFDVRSAAAGAEAIRFLETDTVDLVVLDRNLPDISGLEVLAWIRTRFGSGLPVLFLTNRVCDDQLVVAVGAGADAYKLLRFADLIRLRDPAHEIRLTFSLGCFRMTHSP
ncbi:response regulator [Paraburkholderia sp. Se-20369]|nr:response regulator [Paraburkholderia sp. Se-20369]